MYNVVDPSQDNQLELARVLLRLGELGMETSEYDGHCIAPNFVLRLCVRVRVRACCLPDNFADARKDLARCLQLRELLLKDDDR